MQITLRASWRSRLTIHPCPCIPRSSPCSPSQGGAQPSSTLGDYPGSNQDQPPPILNDHAGGRDKGGREEKGKLVAFHRVGDRR